MKMMTRLLVLLLYLMSGSVEVVSSQNTNPFCHEYNKAKELSESLLLPEGASTQLFVDDPGQRIVTCGRTFFVSYQKLAFADALHSCLVRKLELISLSDKNKFSNCIANLDKLEITMQYKSDDKMTADFWTSGVRIGKNDSNFAWCSEKDDFNVTLPKKSIKPPKSPLCVKVNGSGTLESVDCSTKLRFICEYTCKQPDCYTSDTCKKNSTLMKSPDILGDYFYSQKMDRNFLFSLKMVTWKENWKTCCSMNMTPVEFSDNGQIEELMAQTKVPLYSFWTGGTRQNCVGQFSWCFGLSDSIWRLNVLANSESSVGSCVLVSRVRNTTGVVLYAPITEVCHATASLACVSYTNQSAANKITTVEATDFCKVPTCSNLKTCQKNPNFFARDLLIQPTHFGNITQACGNYLLLPDFELTWQEAFNYCCSIGMNLVTIFSSFKLHCFYDVLDKEPFARGTHYWTSGHDLDCAGAHRSCASNHGDFLKPTLKWRLPKQNNTCVVAVLEQDGNDIELVTADCGATNRFVCEARPKAKSKLTAVLAECKQCYLTCLAERMGFLSDTKRLNENTILGHIRDFQKFYKNVMGQQQYQPDNLRKQFNMSTTRVQRFLNQLFLEQQTDNHLDSYEIYKSSFQSFRKCQQKQTQIKDECTFVAQFLDCFLENVPDMKDLVLQYNDNSTENSPIDLNTACYETEKLPNKCTTEACIANKKEKTRYTYRFEVPSLNYSAARQFCKSIDLYLPFAIDQKDYEDCLTKFRLITQEVIFWGEIYWASDGWRWCRSNEPMENITVRGSEAYLPIGCMHAAGEQSEMRLVSYHDNTTVDILICQGLTYDFQDHFVALYLNRALKLIERGSG